MCGYQLWAERKTEEGWRWLKKLPYAYKQEGAFESAFAAAGATIREDHAATELPWSRYRILDTNCRGDCVQLDLGDGHVVKTDDDDYGLGPGKAFHPADRERELHWEQLSRELMDVALGRARRREVIAP